MSYRRKKIHIDSIIYDDRKMELCLDKIGQRIKQERVKQGISISELGVMANLSISCVSKAESDRCRISLKALIKIAAALDVPVETLLLLEKEEKNAKQEQPDTGNEPCPNLTGSERFGDMTKDAEEDIVDFILEMTDDLMRVIRKGKGDS